MTDNKIELPTDRVLAAKVIAFQSQQTAAKMENGKGRRVVRITRQRRALSRCDADFMWLSSARTRLGGPIVTV